MTAPTPSAHAAPIPPSSHALAPSAIASGVVQILASHGVLAVAGVISLPILVRRLGPTHYGALSYFSTVLGVVAYLDFARPILIPRCARGSSLDDARAKDIVAANLLWMALAAGLAGLFLFGYLIAIPLTAAIALHAASSRDFATLCSHGRVGAATGIRQIVWGGAVLSVAGLSFVTSSVEVFAWCFVAANLAIACIYRAMAGGSSGRDWRGLVRLPARSLWKDHETGVRDVIGFNIASAVMVCADRVILQHNSVGDDFGRYAAHTDLALKLTIFGTAMGSVIYPLLARSIREDGEDATAKRLLSLASKITPIYFVGILALIFLDRQVITFFLGPEYLESRGLFRVTLIGVFLQHFGFLLTPWLRSRGDFASPRRAYNTAAVIMVVAGLVLVPRYGAFGAILAYLFSRSAELLLLVHECRCMPVAIRPRWRLAATAAMVAILLLAVDLRF